MKILYLCESCGNTYKDKWEAMRCEFSHINCDEDIPLRNVEAFCVNYLNDTVCDFCENSYYVYGCELNCDKKKCQMDSNRPDFVFKKNKFKEKIEDFKKDNCL